MRTICDDCPCLNEDSEYGEFCRLHYKIDDNNRPTISDNCKLVKIVTEDTEILPQRRG